MRKYWADFIQDCDILVYVVDAASDDESLRLAGEELQRILDDPGLDNVPLILLANKQVRLHLHNDTNASFNQISATCIITYV